MRSIFPSIQQMPAHHTQHQHHHHGDLYNIDPDAGELISPQPPRPQHQPAPPAPRAQPARMASAGGGRGAARALQAQAQQGEPARGAEGARPWDRDWGTVPDPLGDEALPLVGEVYGRLTWANQGTTRGLRNQPFDAVLLPRDGGNPKVPPGGWAAPEDQERVRRVSNSGGVARQGADVAGLPGRGCGTLHHGRRRQQLAPPGLAQRPRPLALPPAQPAAAAAPAPTEAAAPVTAQTADASKWGGELGPPTHAPPTIRRDGGARATSRGTEGGDNKRGGEPTAPQPANRRPLTLTAAPGWPALRDDGEGDKGSQRGPARVRPPSRRLTPRAGTARQPPLGRQGAAPGDQRAPPTPPPLPLRPKRGQRQTEETAAPHPPKRGPCGRGEGAPRPRQAPPVNRPHAPALPAADRRRIGGTQDGANGAAPSEAGLGKTGARTRAGGSPALLPRPRRTDPLAADRAAPDARGRPATPTARVYPGGARRRQQMAGRRGGGGRWGGPPTPPPSSPIPA